MNIIEAGDVNIRAASAFWDDHRLQLSSGTEMTTDDQLVATDLWREPSDQEVAILRGEGQGDEALEIRVVPFPPELLEMADALGVTSISCQREVSSVAIARSSEYLGLLNGLRSVGRSMLDHDNGFNMQSIRCEPTLGLRSATYDEQTRRYVGLHVDDWDHLPVEGRHRGRQRLVLNLGTENRFLVFCHHSVRSGCGRHSSDVPGVEDVHRFLQGHKQYPIVRLSICPGEAYIAPIQAVFHDGTTVGRTSPDLSLSMIGHFG